MDATFRRRRAYRNQGLGGVVGFTALSALGLCLATSAPNVPNRVVFAAVIGGLPLLMAGLYLWMVAAYRRHVLQIQGSRIDFRGVLRQVDIDLREVTRAHWRATPGDASLVLRTESARLSVHFRDYEDVERDQIVNHLRSVLPPEIQTGWNLFAYKVAFRKPRTKPGPGEILFRREHWDRYLLPSFVLAALAGAVAWWMTSKWGWLAAPVPVLLGLAVLRTGWPADGVVERKLSHLDTAGLLGFLAIWLLVGAAMLLADMVARPKHVELDSVTIAGAVAWFAVLLFEGSRQERLRARREQDAADLAAKARGETAVDPWPID